MASIRWSKARPSLSLSEQALYHYMHCTLNYKQMNILLDELGNFSYLADVGQKYLPRFTNPNRTV